MDSASDLVKHAQDLRATWQGRALAHAEGRMMIAMTSILAHTFDDAMPILLRVVKPKCWDDGKQSLKTPFLCSAGKISKGGQIVADTILYDGAIKVSKVLFADTRDFECELRKLADRLVLSDNERVEFFTVAKNWVVADYRLDPNMNPQDPDARRLVH